MFSGEIETVMELLPITERKAKGLSLLSAGKELASEASEYGFVMATFQADWLAPLLAESSERRGISMGSSVGPFGQITELVRNENSVLYERRRAHVIILADFEDLFAKLYENPFLSEAEFQALFEARSREMEIVLQTLLDRMEGLIMIPLWSPLHLPHSQLLSMRSLVRGAVRFRAWREVVEGWEERSERISIIDLDGFFRERGLAMLRDDRFWALARMRFTPDTLGWISEAIAIQLAVRVKAVRKVIVTDLDLTLWGGVLGEVGGDRLQCGNEGLGFAYREYQKWLLKMSRSGFVLAICSKNQEEEALRALAQHPEFLVRPGNFASWRINWQDKASNLKEISQELGLGLDSFIFIDDHPAEREWIRQALPMVEVPEIDSDPVLRLKRYRELESVCRQALTKEDQDRGRGYQVQKDRRELGKKSGSFEDYLRSLQQEVTIFTLDEALLPRAYQLGERTNQFNLTSRRYSVADWERFFREKGDMLLLLSLRDRFDDQGVTGLSRVCFEEGTARIDLLLMSCRVLGRRVEDVFLREILRRIQMRGVNRVVGEYLPTKKNELCCDFYSQNGFVRIGESRYCLEIGGSGIPDAPAWIKVMEGNS